MNQEEVRDSAKLLLEIARCPVVERVLAGCAGPFSHVVRSQVARTFGEFQVPEPWMGAIASAPLLFLASNPSIEPSEVFPSLDWPESGILSFFEERFHEDREWLSGYRALQADGTYSRSIPFWSRIRARAEELFEGPVRLGTDVAFTEVVHCKSRAEEGVAEALSQCADRYLTRVLGLSPAPVIVVLGNAARRAMNQALPATVASDFLAGPFMLGGRERLVAYLPHPNAHMKRRFDDVMPEALPLLRAALAQGTARPLLN